LKSAFGFCKIKFSVEELKSITRRIIGKYPYSQLNNKLRLPRKTLQRTQPNSNPMNFGRFEKIFHSPEKALATDNFFCY